MADEMAQLRQEVAELKRHNAQLEREAKVGNALNIFRKGGKKPNADPLAEENERLKSEMALAETQSLEQMASLKQTIRTLTASLEKLEKEQQQLPTLPSSSSAAAAQEVKDQYERALTQKQQQHDQAIKQLEASLREAQQKALSAEQAASAANHEAAAQAVRHQEQIMEQMQTVNRLHEELREVRSKMVSTTESTFASERQLGQLQQAVQHEQEARRRAELDFASAQDECKRLGQKISELQTQIESSRHDVLRAQGADAAVKGVVESVQQELANVRSELTARELTIAELKRSVADERAARQAETSALQRALDDAVRLAGLRAEEAAATHQADVQAAEEMLAAVRAGASEARAQLLQANSNLASLRDRFATVETELATTVSALRQAQSEAAAARTQAAALEAETQRLANADQGLLTPPPQTARSAQLDRLQADVRTAEESLQELQRVHAGTLSALQAAEQRQLALEQAKNALDNEIRNLTAQLDEKTRAAQDGARRVQQLDVEIASLVLKSSENTRILQELADTVSRRETEIEALGKHRDALQLEIKHGQEARQALEREMADLAISHNKQMATAEQVHKMEVLGLQQRMGEEIAQLQARIKAAADENDKLKIKALNQDRTLNEMSIKIAEVEAEARKRQNAQMDADRLQEEVNELKQTLADVEAEGDAALQKYNHDRHQLQADLDRTAAELVHATERIAELEAKCADLTTQLTAAESTVAQLQSLVPELDAAKEHVEALTTQVKQLEEQLAESKQQLEDAEMERKTVERKHAGVLKDMQKQLDRLRQGGAGGSGASSLGPKPTLAADGRNRSDASITSARAPSPATEPASLLQENESLVQRLAEAQTRGWDLEEQLRNAKLRTKNQDEELRTKTEVIQQYMLREFAGELKPLPPHVAATLAMASDNSPLAMALSDTSGGNISPMKAVQASTGMSSPGRGAVRKGKPQQADAAVLLQVNNRLQSVLEDLMTKNTRLQFWDRRPDQARVDQLEREERSREK